MIFAPARLGSVTLDNGTLAADKKGCRRFGPCGVGEKALYLNSFSSTGTIMWRCPRCAACSSVWP